MSKARRQTAFRRIRCTDTLWTRRLRSNRPTLILVRNGQVTVRTAKGTYCALSGDSILLQPGTYEVEATPAVIHGNIDFEIATFPLAVLGRGLSDGSQIEALLLNVSPSDRKGVYVQQGVVEFLDRELAAVPFFFKDVEKVAIRIINSLKASAFQFLRFAFFEKRWALLSMLEAHALRPSAVEWLGANYIDGRAAFFRDCKIFVGMSPARWVKTRRMELARAWLRHGQASVEAIAKILGYCNVRAFRTALWKEFEMSIDELRDTEGLRKFGIRHVPMRPFWWPVPMPLIGRKDELVIPEKESVNSKPEEALAENVCTDFFDMKPDAVSRIIPFPARLPALLAAA